MSKDNENVPVPFLTSDTPASERVQAFAPSELIACEACLRNNPPTRINCLYCGKALPANSAEADLQKPELRPLENWEQGYNNILKSSSPIEEAVIATAADLLKLESSALSRILSANHPLPLARPSTRDEATLVQRRLQSFGIDTEIVPDVNLGDNNGPFRVRALQIDEHELKIYERQGASPLVVLWSEIGLLVVGRLTIQRLESREESARRKENRILESSEFFTDETIFDFYTRVARPFRILAKSFDFSCLGARKGLLAEENMSTLLTMFRERARNATWDDSYNSVRKSLEAVWPSERNDHSGGWRRDRPGKLTKGNITEISNESQFQKYSRLCHYLRPVAENRSNEES